MKELKTDRTIKGYIPPLSEQEYNDLEADIIENGCEQPLDIWAGNDIILDGHNRYDICMKHDIDFYIKERVFATRTDALIWMLRRQMGRRNLTDAKRIEMALKRKELQNASPCFSVTRDERKEMAKDLKVSESNITKVKVVLDEGTAKQKKAMTDGDESISKTYKEVRHIEPKKEYQNGGVVQDTSTASPREHADVGAIPTPTTSIPDGFQACHYCKGTGIEKKVVKSESKFVTKPGSIRCQECGREHWTNLEGLKECKGCGAGLN